MISKVSSTSILSYFSSIFRYVLMQALGTRMESLLYLLLSKSLLCTKYMGMWYISYIYVPKYCVDSLTFSCFWNPNFKADRKIFWISCQQLRQLKKGSHWHLTSCSVNLTSEFSSGIGLFRLLMKQKFHSYFLRPFGKVSKLISV